MVIFLLSSFMLFLSKCINHAEQGNDLRGRRYAGSISCRQCHQAVYDSFITTSHFHATMPAVAENIQGDFSNEKNIFVYNDSEKVVLEKRDSGYYQVLYKNGKEKKAYRFDVLFGRRHAQTSLFWQDSHTYELPVSHYSSVDGWATSPGFSSTQPNFERFIGTDCFECHSSYIGSILTASVKGITEEVKKETLIYGIDCERCHGPALAHVNYQLDNPSEKMAMYISKSSSFTQQQKLDACAVCHSGNDKMKLEPRFKFKMGDTLSHFFMAHTQPNAKDFDVHGNQYSLLSESKCFLNSNNMTCSTCHDPHANAIAGLAVYSQKCLACHHDATQQHVCPETSKLGEAIKTNCIDCHMPQQPSHAISFKLPGSTTVSSYLLRTHKIAIYSDSSSIRRNLK
ncbi:MAG: multiheme c-type cytochrome [Ferruginibacter sp.]